MVKRKEGAKRVGEEEHGEEEERNIGKGIKWRRKERKKGGGREEVPSTQTGDISIKGYRVLK